ncbi:type VI secretion system baseplate subunit TssE [Archangium violaceum]|uniref:type VI secretion system baseplate subunit TssE n=1 Tax=Archangium violaceum TaxID=83451 RepID=UPI00193B2573|nr:type VI secretion system baseplate subunit TssE [Archangium violaceum]QRK13273.1 type VI secretion system baseplate subunit TssE [Archangium violaceum]
MAERGLLTRLASSSHGALAPRGNAVAAIAEHLRVLLNTRKGEAAAAPGFGIMDFNDIIHLFPAAIPRMQQSIRTAIQEFEPRLKNVVVMHVPDEQDPTALRFDIIAQLNIKDARGTVRFHTELQPGGRVDLW